MLNFHQKANPQLPDCGVIALSHIQDFLIHSFGACERTNSISRASIDSHITASAFEGHFPNPTLVKKVLSDVVTSGLFSSLRRGVQPC